MPPILLFVRFEFNIYGFFQVWKFITLAPRLTYEKKTNFDYNFGTLVTMRFDQILFVAKLKLFT